MDQEVPRSSRGGGTIPPFHPGLAFRSVDLDRLAKRAVWSVDQDFISIGHHGEPIRAGGEAEHGCALGQGDLCRHRRQVTRRLVDPQRKKRHNHNHAEDHRGGQHRHQSAQKSQICRFRQVLVRTFGEIVHLHSTVAFVIGEAPPQRLDKALARDVPEQAALSRTRLARLLSEGAVRVNGAIVTDAKGKVAEGDAVEITVQAAAESHILPEEMPLEIVFEDDALIVVNKPAGLVVHPAPGSPSGTLVNGLMAHCGASLSGVGGVARPGIVHRIDKDTSGLLVVAKSDVAHHGLAEQFAKHSAERAYQALCYGVPEASDPRLRGVRGVNFETGNVMKITSMLARHKTDRQRQAVIWEGGRHAVTRARLLERFGTPPTLALLECRLETGRTHQIRVHLAHVGHGLVGDPVYGGRRKLPKGALPEGAAEALAGFQRQALHAAVLGFEHPVSGEAVRFEAELPEDFRQLLASLT